MAPKKAGTPSNSKPSSPSKGHQDPTVSAGTTPPPKATTTPVPGVPATAPSNGKAAGGPKRVEGKEFETGSEIKFYDQEVTRMHAELAKRDAAHSTKPREPLRKRRPSPVTVRGFVVRTFLLYVLIAYFFVCPNYDSSSDPLNHPLPSRAICRALLSVENTLMGYEPLARPYLLRASKKLDPYVNKVKTEFQPYLDFSRPYYSKAEVVVRPFLKKGIAKGRELLVTVVLPHSLVLVEKIKVASQPALDLVKREYQANLEPTVDWYTGVGVEWYQEKLAPHLLVVKTQLSVQSTKVYRVVAPYYLKAVPVVKKHYYKTVLPFLRKSGRVTRSTYFNHVQPRLLKGGKSLVRFYNHKVLPGVHHYYSLYITPQVDKILEKVFEYKEKALETGSSEEKIVSMKQAEVEVETEAEETIKSNLVVEEVASLATSEPVAVPTSYPVVAVEEEEEAGPVVQTEDEILEDFIAELRDDPSSIEEDPVAESTSSAEAIPPTPEELALITAEKRTKLEADERLHAIESERLAKSQLDSLVTQLATIRTQALSEIPTKFSAVVELIDDESDRIVGALGKYFAKAAKNDKLSLKEKVEDSHFLAKKGLAKIKGMYQDAVREIDQYRIGLGELEQTAVDKARRVMESYVSQASERLRQDWSWLSDVTYKDWERYHQQVKVDDSLIESFSLVQTGHLPVDALLVLENPNSLLDATVQQLDLLVEAFEEMIEKIKIKGQHELGADDLVIDDEAEPVSPVVEVLEPEPATPPTLSEIPIAAHGEPLIEEASGPEPTATLVEQEGPLAVAEALLEEAIEEVLVVANVVSSWAEPHPSFAPSKVQKDTDKADEKAAEELAYTVASAESVFASRLASVEKEAASRSAESRAEETISVVHDSETTGHHDEL